jgi:hypothetical protein
MAETESSTDNGVVIPLPAQEVPNLQPEAAEPVRE